MKTYKLLLAVCMAFFSLAATAQDAFRLSVNLEQVKNNKGNIFVELYSDPATFRKSAKAFKIIKTQAVEGASNVTFENLAAGTYAVLTYHDEDGNNEMNKRFGMIPTEGYGLSNNPKVMGPPSFKDSQFEVRQDTEISIHFNY
ncbi:DUF2141 domain-containing protein [Methylotenera sp. G11]|uniref:DUF2141 domain-containing protein n=1 Tax=Methylotenera sp. G11 TaxID=1506585 RepID=UPI00069170E1|nr:DUF2141 domain-containing protein [Methylotenera sp. G11]